MAHTHEGDSTYYLDQLCTIFFCGALGAVCILMFRQDMLQYILTPFFYKPVLWGGATLLVLVVIRAVALWKSAGRAGLAHHHHEHDHDHHHDHGHEHHHHDHDHEHDHDHHDPENEHDHEHGHDHGHSHGWTPVKYAVLLIPLALYVLNLPNSSLASSAQWLANNSDNAQLDTTIKDVQDKDEISLGFKELSNAAYSPQLRELFEGHVGILKGMYSPLVGEKEFTLFRVKINCCAADAIPIGVHIISPENLTRLKQGQWVEVKGQIQFRKAPDKDKYFPVLQLKSKDDVKPIPPQPNDYDI